MKQAWLVLALTAMAWPTPGWAQVRDCDHAAEQVCLSDTLACIAKSCDPRDTDVQSNVDCRSKCYVNKGKCLRQAECLE